MIKYINNSYINNIGICLLEAKIINLYFTSVLDMPALITWLIEYAVRCYINISEFIYSLALI